MCGIVVTSNISLKNKVIELIKTINRRGPDNNNYLIKDEIIFCHTRLIFFDLSNNSNQPVKLDNGGLLLFNGEIFNYDNLGEFNSDTLYIKSLFSIANLNNEFLIKNLNKLNGFFSIVFYKDGIIYSIRDRFGEKPLYISIVNSEVCYSSEIFSFENLIDIETDKSFLKKISENPFTVRKVKNSLLETQYKKIYEQKPGTVIMYSTIEKKIINSFEWYDLSSDINIFKNFDLKDLIEDSINIRLKSDVPGGIALSGGVDSSVISFFTNKNTKQKIDAFSYISSHSSYDESSVIKGFSKNFENITMNYINENYEVNFDLIINSMRALGMPYFDSNIAQIKFYEKVRNSNNKFIVEGHGADELFLGYNQHSSMLFWISLFSLNIKNSYNSLVSFFSSYIEGYPLRYKILTLFKSLYLLIISKKEKIYNYEFSSKKSLLFESFFKTILPKLLNNYDKTSMYNSIESRSPFLDHRVVANVLAKDLDFFISHQSKNFLRKILSENNIVVPTKKRGFRSFIWKSINENNLDKLFIVFNKTNIKYFGKKSLSSKEIKNLLSDYKFEIYFWKVISYYTFINYNSIKNLH